MGWCCYLDDRLHFPFTAECTSKRIASPLRVHQEVEVIGMAPEEECERDMYVMICWDNGELAVPLSQLTPIHADKKTREAIEDWHYWIKKGYRF